MFRFVPARCVTENSKKITKEFRKLKNTINNSFQVKIGWKKMRKRETKIIVPFCYVPAQCIIENSIKIVKNSKKKKKKYDYGSFQVKIGRKRMRNKENKNYRFVSFLPDAQKKIPKKIKKSKKYHCGFISCKN